MVTLLCIYVITRAHLHTPLMGKLCVAIWTHQHWLMWEFECIPQQQMEWAVPVFVTYLHAVGWVSSLNSISSVRLPHQEREWKIIINRFNKFEQVWWLALPVELSSIYLHFLSYESIVQYTGDLAEATSDCLCVYLPIFCTNRGQMAAPLLGHYEETLLTLS